MKDIKDNLEKIFNEIKNGNNLGEKITLVGATKTVSPEIINTAISYGLNVVAENKVQEFRDKTNLLSDCEQHFIGHLQSNKVKYLVGNVNLIQSVDTLSLAEEISKIAVKRNFVQNILAEVNISGEESKSGISPIYLRETIKKMASFNGIKICGLMTMLPKDCKKDIISNFCLQMREFYDTLLKEGYPFKYLSIGMSDDYKIAIKNGSNMIRIGSAIFGKRNYGEN